MNFLQRFSEMTARNGRIAHVTDPGGTVLLEMGERSFVVLRAPDAFEVYCLRGSVWMTQEARRDDIQLAWGDHCCAHGSQRVFLNSFKGALLSISGVDHRPVDSAGLGFKSLDLRLEITQGAYALSVGCGAPRDAVPTEHSRQNGQPVAAASMDCP